MKFFIVFVFLFLVIHGDTFLSVFFLGFHGVSEGVMFVGLVSPSGDLFPF